MPDNRNATADNGGESENHKAAGLVSSIARDTRLTAEDRHAAYCAGYDDGMHHQASLAVEERARALLRKWADESRDLAQQYARVKGPAWAAIVLESGDRDD